MSTDNLLVKNAKEFRDDFLRTLRNGLIRAGVTNPNVSPGSDYYILGSALGNELEVLSANHISSNNDVMPDTAVGDGLDRWLDTYNISRRNAVGSILYVTFAGTATSLVSLGTELLDGNGLKYAVAVGGSYQDGDYIEVNALSTGTSTNLEPGDTLKWVTVPAFAEPTVAVFRRVEDGCNDEDDETGRRRLLRRLAFPPGSGNWSQYVEVAEKSSPYVQGAFCYPAVDGPSTVHVACVGYTSSTSKSRKISSTVMTGIVAPYIIGKMYDGSETVITTVEDEDFDLSIDMSLPYPDGSVATSIAFVTSSGGWSNSTPFPRPTVSTGNRYCDVTAVTSTTRFKVTSSSAPVAGVSKVCWLSPYDWKLYTATVKTVYNNVSPFDVEIDKPFTGVTVGCYISPQAVRSADYFQCIVDGFAKMGPGEKTDNSSVLSRGKRRPTSNFTYNYTIGSWLLKDMSDVGEEVLDVQFAYRSGTTPSIPSSVTDPPNCFVPRHLGIYELGQS